MASAAGGSGDAAATAAATVAVGTDMVRHARGRPRARGELRVLVTRYWARGHGRDEFTWMRALSPSAGLLGRYKGGEIGWDEFASEYAGQIASDPSACTAVQELHAIAASGRRVVLYCHEAPGSPCHRHILREMVAAGMAAVPAALVARARFEDVDGGGGCAAAAAERGGAI